MIYSLSEICASGGQMPVITLTFENEKAGVYRYVLGYTDVTINKNTYPDVGVRPFALLR